MFASTLFAIRKAFPSVEQISTETVQKWLSDSPERVRLLDVREENEYKVSHIATAERVAPDDGTSDDQLTSLALDSLEKNKDRLVCYCSIGYRSSAMVHRINKLVAADARLTGRLSAFNVEGSLFKWANEGRPLVDQRRQQTTFAHPYNAFWGKLLNADCRKEQP